MTNEVQCPCCLGAGKIELVSAPRSIRGFTTAKALAARVGYSYTTVNRHIGLGILKASVGEVRAPYRSRGKTTWRTHAVHLIANEDADAYAEDIAARRGAGIRYRNGRGREMVAMADNGHPIWVIAKKYGIQEASARRTIQRIRAQEAARHRLTA